MTDISQAARVEVAAARRVFFWIAIVFPSIFVLASTAVIVAWLPQLPDPIATHWGVGAAPDGFSAPISAVWMTLGFGIGLTALLGGIVWFEMRQRPDTWGWTQRFLGAVTPGIVAFIMVLTVGMVGMQRGLSDATQAGNVDQFLWIAAAVAIVIGTGAWLVQPKAEFARPAVTGAPIELAPEERAVWIAEARMSAGALISLGVLVLALVTAGAVVLATGANGWWVLPIVVVLVLFGIVTCTIFRVRIDARGLLVRSLIGWPRFHYTPDRIAAVAVADISPMAEYGGWGLRMIPGSTGLVMRAGEAIQVTLTSGRTFVVTVDDAATGAGLLQTVVRGQHGGRETGLHRAPETELGREGDQS